MSVARPLPVRVARRLGFTLIELMVVLAIMSMLMGLLIVGVRKAMIAARQSGMMFDISKIATAIESVKAKSGAYPPCMGAITGGQVNGNLIDRGQIFNNYMRRAFPRSLVTYDNLRQGMGSSGAGGSYAYSYRTTTGGGGKLNIQTLDQAEAIVFWLGGFPTPYNSAGQPMSSRKLIGFNTDPTNPFRLDQSSTITSIAATRTVPLFDFDDGRLGDADYDGWLEYYPAAPDPFNPSSGPAPYVYFDAPLYMSKSTAAAPVSYLSYPSLGGNAPSLPPASQYVPGLIFIWGVACPYASGNLIGGQSMQWANPNTFQIISAGLDNTYGPATLRATVPATGNVYLNAQAGSSTTIAGGGEEDNLTNFLDVPVGSAYQP